MYLLNLPMCCKVAAVEGREEEEEGRRRGSWCWEEKEEPRGVRFLLPLPLLPRLPSRKGD